MEHRLHLGCNMRFAILLLACIGCGVESANGPPILLVKQHDLGARDGAYDVALGYDLYEDTLGRYGEWRRDEQRIVKWCPEGGFIPFRTDGKWVRDGKKVRWMSTSNDWRNTTTRSGRWVLVESTDEWCWVPGVVQHDTPVIWRGGNGYIGWAPKPPHGEHLPARAWTYIRLRALHAAPIEPLDGEDEEAARAQTSPIGVPYYRETIEAAED